MSIKLMTAVWDTKIGPATRRLVLLALADIANDDGEAWPSIDTLATRANCSRTTAEDSLRSLVGDGIIERESRGFHRSNMYRINHSALTPGFRGPPKTPEKQGDDPRIPGRETPENPGTEPSVEPPLEPLTPDVEASASTSCPTVESEDHDQGQTDLFGAGVQPPANGHHRNESSHRAPRPSEGDSRATTVGSTPTVSRRPARAQRDADAAPLFEEFWTTYAHKVGKGGARKAWTAACRKADPREVINAAARYAASRRGEDSRFTAHAATWLNQERWLDEPEYARNGSGPSGDRRGSGVYTPYQQDPDCNTNYAEAARTGSIFG